MTIVKSEQIKGSLTHWLKPEYKEKALTGEFKLSEHFCKPTGLWLSWNEGWEKWCASESDFISGKVCLQAKLKKGLNVWLIDSLQDFLKMWKSFSDLPPFITSLGYKKTFWFWLQKEHDIDAIALTDKGQWETRFDTFMYGWDCESIVVFNPNNIILQEMK